MRDARHALWAGLVLAAAPLAAAAQQVNPADKTREEAREAQEPGQEPEEPEGFQHEHSWELPPTVVTAQRPSPYREEDRIGPYAQPRWTARRLFPTTRIYVIPPGQIEFEFWTRVEVPRDSGKTSVLNQYEVEIGLPHRFQLDLYYDVEKAGSEGELDNVSQRFELRWALADWGKILWNPTLYAEYVERSEESDKYEAKLLLGDELAPGWHWGSNLVYERELGGELENEYELTFGLARTLIDEQLSLGAEMKAALTNTHADRDEYEQSLEIGPSLQWRPLPQMHIDVAPLIGIGDDSRAADIFVVAGWEF